MELQYRRLSRALEQLMPRLIDQAVSVFGEEAAVAALHEFVGWPDPAETPDEDTIERLGPLFWPWFLFNWEYEETGDEEDPVLDGAESVTIAELLMDRQNIDPDSLEGKLLEDANRSPYSFLEVVGIRKGRSLQVRDVFTGTKMTVHERLGSLSLKKGDILFGRAVQVDGVGMFVGTSSYVIPPETKPALIDLRRELMHASGKITPEALFVYEAEIRYVYLGMDEGLHTPPPLQNTDGDPLRNAVETEIFADVRRHLKLDRPEQGRGGVRPEKIAERVVQIKKRIAEFGDRRLHDTYTALALNLCDAVAASDALHIHRGRIDIWSAAIVYATAQLNFLFSSKIPEHLTPDELCDWYQVNKNTVSQKSHAIRSTLEIFFGDKRFCAPHIAQIFNLYEDEAGFVYPETTLSPQSDDQPPALKPSRHRTRQDQQKEPPPAKPKKEDDKQLSLFDE